MVNLENISVNDIIGVAEGEEPKAISTQSLILNLIKEYPDGVSVKMVADRIGISSERARVILNELCLKREIYKRNIPSYYLQ
jgi:DNA-binding IclR family transcriptional regulator